MIETPKHIQDLKSYKPGKPIPEIVQEFGLGRTAILWNNENNFGAAPKALEAIQNASANSFLYPDPACLQLRGDIAALVGRKTDNIIVGNGSESVFNYILQAYFTGDDELLTSEGTFVAIYIWAKAHNVPVVKCPLTKEYGFDLEGILQRIGPKTKAVYLSNPNNPSGAMITRDELIQFIERVPQEVMVLVDEAYFEYAQDLTEAYPDSTRLDYPNLITLRTFSKAYGIAGIRIGYGVGTPELIAPLMKVKLTFEPSNLAQAAAIGALTDEEFLEKTVANNTRGLRYFYDAFSEMGLNYIPSFGNFVMIDFETADRAQALFEALMRKGVFVRQLPAFGLPHCIRITIGTPEENEWCVEKLREVL